MEPWEVLDEIKAIKGVLGANRVLDSFGYLDVEEARLAHEVDRLKALGIRRGKKSSFSNPWKLDIGHESPMVFQGGSEDQRYLQVDLTCSLAQPKERKNAFPLLAGWVLVRIWSTRKKLFSRFEFDSESIRRKTEARGRRVMLRFHFDRAARNGVEPIYHFHFGGAGKFRSLDEYCWHPPDLTLPRFVHHPVNLILACEYIVANFFPKKFDKISNEPAWSKAVQKAQDVYVKPYIDSILKRKQPSVLRHLWH